MAKKPERQRRVVLRGYGQIRAFFREMGFNPPPHEATLYKWARHKECPISKAMDGSRVVADAKDLAKWIRVRYFGRRVGEVVKKPAPDDDNSVST